MTPLAEVEVRLSEVRKRLAAIGSAELNDETEGQNWTISGRNTPTLKRAVKRCGWAAKSEPEKIEKRADHGEDLELRELRDSVQFGTYVAAAIGGHPVFNGAEAEYNATPWDLKRTNSRLNCWAATWKLAPSKPMVKPK